MHALGSRGFYVGTSIVLALTWGPGLLRAATIDATWSAGNGAYADPASWRFSAPPTAATIPDNDSFDRFRVFVEGGVDVLLSSAVEIDRIELDAGSELAVAGELGLADGAELQGSGTLRLDGASGGRIFGFGSPFSTTLVNGASSSILGGGVIDLDNCSSASCGVTGELENRGLIHADQAGALALEGGIHNLGNVLASGAGGLSMTRTFANHGLFEATGTGLVSLRFVDNEGTFRVGSGARVHADSFSVQRFDNRGELEIASGGTLELTSLTDFEQNGIAPRTRIGGALIGPDVNVRAGLLQLDGGRVEASRVGVGVARLEGTGRIETRTGGAPIRFFGSTIVPGGDGVGSLAFVGDTWLNDTRVEVGVVDALRFDDLAFSGGARLSGDTRIAVDVDAAFLPAPGDSFRILTSDTPIVFETALSDLVETPALADRTFLVGTVDRGGADLVLRALAARDATWSGGNGAYEDATRWSVDAPLAPGSQGVPTRDDFHLFHTRIGGDSSVSLGRVVELESFELGTGSELAVQGDGGLLLGGAANRPGSRSFRNDGVVRLGASALPRLQLDGSYRLDGSGEIALDGSSISPFGDQLIELTNGAGHTIRGSGSLSAGRTSFASGRFVNEGRVHADVAGGLLIDSDVENHGELLASGPGELRLDRSLRSDAGSRIEVRDGASIVSNHNFGFSSAGELLVHGAGSRLLRTGGLESFGDVAVRDAGLLSVGDYFSSGQTTIASGGELESGFVGFNTLTLDQGLVDGLFGEGVRLEGTGRAAFVAGVDVFGSVAPGADGVGTLELEGDLRLARGASLEIQLGGTEAGVTHDLLTVLGTSFLDGTIVVDWIDLPNGALPSEGDVYDVLRSSALALGSSVEEQILLPELMNGLHWGVAVLRDGSADVLRLSVLPEPRAGLLLVLGLVALTRTGRKSRSG